MRRSRVLLVLAVLTVVAAVTRAIYGQPSGEQDAPARFETKVIKAYTAKDGNAIFRAYAVEWKGQEVIASDALAGTDYREGDTITVLAMNHPYPQGKEPRRLLGFVVVSKGK